MDEGGSDVLPRLCVCEYPSSTVLDILEPVQVFFGNPEQDTIAVVQAGGDKLAIILLHSATVKQINIKEDCSSFDLHFRKGLSEGSCINAADETFVLFLQAQ